MNKEIKTKLITALRSDNYVQGTGKLRDKENKFCVLGVLCDVVGCTWEYDEHYAKYRANGEFFNLPDDIYVKTELTNVEERYLMNRNDEGHTFEEIAELIDELL